MAHTQEKEQSIQTAPEEALTLILLDKDFKSTIINISKNYRKSYLKN